MRINHARRKLLEGATISGLSLLYPSPEIAEEAAQYGFDFVVLDWQHGAWSEPALNAVLAAYVRAESVPLVRTIGADPAWIGRMLDLGALGVIVPMVETPEQCEAIVRAAKFPPLGMRSATGLRTAYHANHNYLEYTREANGQMLIVVMVETVLGVRNIRDMMAVPGVDCVLIGPYDLTLSAGATEIDDPRSIRLKNEVLDASKETGVPAGYYSNTPAEAEERAAEGFRMVFLGHDMVQLPQAFSEMRARSTRLAELYPVGTGRREA